MPINGVLDMQRRSLQLGEIRMGASEPVPGKTYSRPVRLEAFRFTTASEAAAYAVAEKYSGSVTPWTAKRGRFQVFTDRTALDVWVPPRGLAVDANMEAWDGPRCLARCDGVTMTFPTRQPCKCPQPENPADAASIEAARDERKRLAAMRPPRACKPLTRFNLTITGLPGLLGVWRLNSGSENAAVETADSGDALAIAREADQYLPAVLRMEWRNRALDGSPFQVPVLQIGMSMEDYARGALPTGHAGLMAQLRGGEERRALTAGPAPEPNRALPPAPEPNVPLTAQEIADRVSRATSRAEAKRYVDMAKEQRCGDDLVIDPRQPEKAHEELSDFINARWGELGDGRVRAS